MIKLKEIIMEELFSEGFFDFMKKKSDKPKGDKTIKISKDIDVSFMDGNLQLYGKKGKLGLDKKNMRVLLNLIRKNMGYTFEATKLGVTKSELPSGVKIFMDTTKGLTLFDKKGKPIQLNRKALIKFLRTVKKQMKIS
tara:strand:+ start:44 stop:457 length:414 start_codon:yes stop_codon:yes gene_type:complete